LSCPDRLSGLRIFSALALALARALALALA
jgi:hypothetical protein